MRRTIVIPVALILAISLIASAVSAQTSGSPSKMRFGVGTALTRINDGLLGKTAMMPLGILDFEKAAVEFGFALRSGEDQTQFMLQIGGGYAPVQLPGGELLFGGLFYLETEAVVIGQESNSAFTFGLFSEYRVHATEFLDIGLRVFPFQLISSKDYSRIGLFSPGFTASFFF